MLIFLLGFMGAGKSYTGKRLAERLGYAFVDLDEAIERRAGKSIPQLFSEGGEAHFRALERQCLQSFEGRTNLILSCGGGTPCFFDNMHWMKQRGVTVFLDVDIPLLVERLKAGKEHRPLIAQKSREELQLFISQKLAERRKDYEQAKFICPAPTDGLTVVDHLEEVLKKEFNS